jgi:hypothetical protein
MNHKALPESIDLADCLLTSEQKEIIERATKEIEDKPDAYELDFFWKFDSSIGGIGGYCMPLNPTINPFPGGIGRTLFRPLQYAAADIGWNKDLWNNYRSARSAVSDSGQHLEAVTDYLILRTRSILSPVPTRKLALGQNIDYLAKNGTLPSDRVEQLEHFTRIYNKSKHDVNQSEERGRHFYPADAVVAYIFARILGVELLKPYYPDLLKTLEPYLGRLHSPNWNIQTNSDEH